MKIIKLENSFFFLIQFVKFKLQPLIKTGQKQLIISVVSNLRLKKIKLKMNLRETTSILFVLMRVLYATTSIKEAHYTQWKGYKLHSNTRIMAQDKSSSSFRCWRKCLDTHACVATSYSPTQSGCELHEIRNVLLPIKVIAEKDRAVIVKKGKCY